MRNLTILLAFILMATGSLSAQITSSFEWEFIPNKDGGECVVGENSEIGVFMFKNTGDALFNLRFIEFEYVEGVYNGIENYYLNFDDQSIYGEGLPNGNYERFSFPIMQNLAPGDSIEAVIVADILNPISDSIQLRFSYMEIEKNNLLSRYLMWNSDTDVTEMGTYYIQEASQNLTIIRTDTITDSTTIVAGLDDVLTLSWLITNPGTQDVNISSCDIKIEGTGNAGAPYYYFTGAIFLNNTQQGSSKNFNTEIETFGDISVVVPAGESVEFHFLVNTVESSAPGTVRFSVTNIVAENIESGNTLETLNNGESLSEENPIMGAIIVLVNTATVTYEINTFIPGCDILEGSEENEIINIRFYAVDDAAQIKDIYIENLLDPEIAATGGWQLFANNQLIQSKSMVGNSLHFELVNQDRIFIPRDGYADVWVKFNCMEDLPNELIGKQFQLDLIEIEALTDAIGIDIPTENIFGSATSEIFTIINDPEMGIQNKGIEGTNIYPNPTTDCIAISSDEEISKIELFNSSGQILLSQYGYSEKININDFPVGIYIIRIYTESNNIFQEKIVKK